VEIGDLALLKGCLRNTGLLFFGLMAVIAFQVFIKHKAVIARRILKYAQMSSSFACGRNVFFKL
jgi:hypothetical protein